MIKELIIVILMIILQKFKYKKIKWLKDKMNFCARVKKLLKVWNILKKTLFKII